MPLTPADVSNKLFSKQMRGYSMDEVDAFLDEVEAELTRLLTENAQLAQRAAGAPAAAPVAAPAPVPAAAAAAPEVPAAPAPVVAGEPQEAALRTLLMAQRTADQAVAEARAEADKMLSEAQAKSARVEQEVNARTAAALAELEGRRRELEARIEDLHAFEREYRLRLKAYLEGQLKELSSRGGGDEAGAGVPAAARTAAVGVMPPGVTDSGAARPA
ncbi:MAG: DivIVA domain-containing protein, partial [Mycobacteriales bacterium]